MADTDPPHEVDDREAPADRYVDAPNARAFDHQVPDGKKHHHRQHERDAEANEPTGRGRPLQHDGADLVGHGPEGVTGFDHRGSSVRDFDVVHSVCHDLAALRFQFGFGVTNFGKVGSTGTRVQIRQQPVVAILRFPFRDLAVRVIDVAKRDGARRAGLLAGGLQLASVLALIDLAIFALSINAALVDALYAVGAFLHDAAAAHADIGIPHHLVLLGIPVLEQQEVEAAHLVRTVVRAITRPHAPVVDHVVQAFGAVQGCAHGAHQLAGRVLALHAWDGLEVSFGMVAIALVVSVDAQPVHVAPLHNLFLADDGDVVLRLAGDHAIVAAGAGSGAAGARAAVAKVDGDGIVGMSGLHPDRPGDFAPREFDRDHVLRLELFALGHLGADQDGVVPGQFRHRLGKFLQPAVVGELAVVNGRVSAEIDFEGFGVDGRRGCEIGRLG